MSKSFITSIKIITGVTTLIHYIILIIGIPSVLFGLALAGGNIFTGAYPEIFIVLLFFIVILYIPIKMWRMQDNKKIITFFFIYLVVVVGYHTYMIQLSNSQEFRNQKAEIEHKAERQVFLRDHCAPINNSVPNPVYQCDDGTIR